MNSQRASDFMSREVRKQKFAENFATKLIAYPESNVRELAKIMNDIKIDKIPVVFSPWNRKLVGIVEFNKISIFLND